LFERFHRVEGQRSRSFEGSGIGLALVQELARLHGGTIRVESEVGSGTRFVVSLPFGTAHLPDDRLRSDRDAGPTSLRADAYVEEALRWLPDGPADGELVSPAAAGGAEDFFPGPVGDARILVADDNADMRGYIGRLLGPRWHVETVPDGQAALDRIRQSKPDLLLSDVMMPGLDGFGLLQALRADPALRDLPVIMLSGPGRRRGSKVSMPVPTTTSPSRFRRAS
jgi:hypothetical protein